jgi:hypothetical protein
MSLTLVYLCAIPSTLQANGVKPTTEMTILPLWVPPISSFSLLLPLAHCLSSRTGTGAGAPSLPSELGGGAPVAHARGTSRPHRRFLGAPQVGSPGAPPRGSAAAPGCRSVAAPSRPSRCGFRENAVCHGHG